ncbi:hypothetical protein FIE12Z_11051 [Fusarium flagelliforme]|uniref:HTH CENPB-type domain-containing protein n=1 Tax=Fusarium flagelliforme TaxID=2675880 RepID=A0A395MC85_9HYPO|nr:hypothetical protein FIE12Z_11051 [Fusarium flagelliforme]
MPTDANLKAARAVVLSRQRLQKGLSRDAAGPPKKPLSFRDAEAQYPGSSRASIARIVKRLEAADTVDYDDVAEPKIGRPRMLTEAEEEAIVTYIMWMDKLGLPALKWEIEDAALTLMRCCDPESREGAQAEYEEAGVEDTQEWFQRLEEAIRMKNIGASETWNADEAGVRVEYLLCKQLGKKKTCTPAYASLLPSETRFLSASVTAESIGERYHDILSSPTRQGLKHIRNIVHEAVLLEDVIKKYVDNRKTRIEKRYHERKRGKRAKTVSDLIPLLPDEVRESIPKVQFALKLLNAVDFTALLYSDDTVDFRLTREKPDEEMDEEEETLPLINVITHEEAVMALLPPKSPSLLLLPDYDSPPPSTPCPYKHQTQLHDSLRELIREGRAFAAGSLTGQDNTDTA